MERTDFDILIIGGGHAGLEAAWISSQFNLDICLLTMKGVPLGEMPCNPSVGGVGKGQVVREIDALGGLMGKLADSAGIQYRVLNESKGPAVKSTRVQVDKDVYSKNARKAINSKENIALIEDKVIRVFKEQDYYRVLTEGGNIFSTRAVIITAGTFLGGILHTGDEQTVGGQRNFDSAPGLRDIIDKVEILETRFKTGTPARIESKSVDYSVMQEQKSDPVARNFHWFNTDSRRVQEQVSCHLTRTNPQTLEIIRNNRDRSPLFNGQIKGVGPRYCPSIEDKAFRYPDRDTHHVFIEPEGHSRTSLYPNGLSTSLPKDVQEDFIHSIEGLENAEILEYGYAVEYDVVNVTRLGKSLEYIDLPGLYFAGQINGTSGYEEAAGQGIVAGINASRKILNKAEITLNRDESYIGVMIEDLVSNKRDEPYRLFTARSENRLYIREDNTILRMNKYRKMLEINNDIDLHQEEFIKEYEILSKLCERKKFCVNEADAEYFESMNYGCISENITLGDLLKRSKLVPTEVLSNEVKRFGANFMKNVVATCAISKKYEGYINRASKENEKLVKLGKRRVDWTSIAESRNISNECRARIKEMRPETFSQLQRIEGIRPATLAFVAGNFT